MKNNNLINYNRVLTEPEKNSIEKSAKSMLFYLFSNGSISNNTLEKIIFVSLNIKAVTQKKVDENMLKAIVDLSFFEDRNEINIATLINILINNTQKNNKTIN